MSVSLTLFLSSSVRVEFAFLLKNSFTSGFDFIYSQPSFFKKSLFILSFTSILCPGSITSSDFFFQSSTWAEIPVAWNISSPSSSNSRSEGLTLTDPS